MQLEKLIRRYRILSTGVPEVEFIALRTPALTTTKVQQKSATATYGTTVTPLLSAGDVQNVTILDGVAFAVAAPTGGPPTGYSAFLTFIFLNSSGGAAGAVTWNAAYHLVGAWTAPADTTHSVIQFVWDDVNSIWIETYRSTADIA